MSHRYAPLPNPRSDRDAQHEMEAAFDDSEDEDNVSESHPLNPHSSPTRHSLPTRIPGSYDFDAVDYDYPPPGSPPAPSAVAFPNDHGNSNGVVPTFTLDSTAGPRRTRGWFQRTVVGLLPSHYVRRLGLGSQVPTGAVGGGINNDGVFANVTAKPSRPVRITEGDDTYIVPEDSRPEAPPSYAAAQADAVPPYWETTVHAPFAGDSIGDMIIDSLPTGSLFSFLWNMLVSISFQFVGFLLTYLLHTSHAARFGSRAGLGVTLIQYGFALRSRADAAGESRDSWNGFGARPTFDSAAEAEEYYKNIDSLATGNGTTMTPDMTEEQAGNLVAEATSEWLSFFLMTVGWFILLTSVLGFWRVKRWERGILSSQRENTQDSSVRTNHIISQLNSAFGLRGRVDVLRQGLGIGNAREEREREEANDRGAENDSMHPINNDPDRERRLEEITTNDIRLQQELRAAGFL